MITSNGTLEVQEQEGGTYVFPNSRKFKPSWALYMYSDGRAELYLKRKETGALLGKPISLDSGQLLPLKKQTGTTLIEDLKLDIGEVFQVGADTEPDRFLARFEGVHFKGAKTYDIIKPLS